MPNLKKLLQAARQFEALQANRKAKDVAELQKFQCEQKDHCHLALLQELALDQIYTASQCAAFTASMDAAQQQLEPKIHELPKTESFAQEALELKTQELLDAETFGQEVFEATVATVEPEHFQTLVEPQEIESAQMKQLSPGLPELFTQELSDLTETCLQHELANNDATLKQAQAEAKKNPKRQTLHVR